MIWQIVRRFFLLLKQQLLRNVCKLDWFLEIWRVNNALEYWWLPGEVRLSIPDSGKSERKKTCGGKMFLKWRNTQTHDAKKLDSGETSKLELCKYKDVWTRE